VAAVAPRPCDVFERFSFRGAQNQRALQTGKANANRFPFRQLRGVFTKPDSMASFKPKSLTIQPNNASSLVCLPDGVNGVADSHDDGTHKSPAS
jgi:hypothetical protein